MKKIISIVFVIFFVLSVSPFKALSAEEQKDFDIQGAGTHALWILFKDFENKFEKDTGISLQVWGSKSAAGKGCGAAVTMAMSGEPDKDFGMVCCIMPEEELKESSLVEYPLAWEPIKIIINRENPVDSISLEELKDIFAGKITNWKSVGGNDRPIAVITRLHCSDRTPGWKSILQDKSHFAMKKVNVLDEQAMVNMVSQYDNAIGHLGATWISKDLKSLKINGYSPTSDNIKNNVYTIKRRLAIITRGEAKGKVKAFLDYVKNNKDIDNLYKKYDLSKIED